MNAFQRSAFQNNAFQGGDVPPIPTTPTWGTFPNWWPSRKKREEEFAAEVSAIVAPLPDKSAEIVSELSNQLMHDRADVANLRQLVRAKLAEQQERFTAETRYAVDRIEAAMAQREADEIMQRKIQRNRNAMKILRMLH